MGLWILKKDIHLVSGAAGVWINLFQSFPAPPTFKEERRPGHEFANQGGGQ